MPEKIQVALTARIIKADEDQRMVYGFASVIEEDGQPVYDSHGDMIEVADLLKTAHAYVIDSRQAKAMHKGGRIGEIVESVVFTPEVQKALDIDLGKVGWFIGMKVYDAEVWKRVKDGELAAFSIGGTATREDLPDE